MAIQKVPTEVNFFVKGIITEASPLTFPENASIDERNFVLNRDGSRNRRLGMDILGDKFSPPSETSQGKSFSSFVWENAGGDPKKRLVAVQYGKDLMVFDISSGEPVLVDSFDIKVVLGSDKADIEVGDFASVDGVLVGVFGEHKILKLTYTSSTNTLTTATAPLKIRDQFGLEAYYERAETTYVRDGVTISVTERVIEDLLDDEFSSVRPLEPVPSAHIYNLRNQSWGRERKSIDVATGAEFFSTDPIESFKSYFTVLPSNSDIVAAGLINYAEITGAPVRFAPEELGLSPLASSSSSRGYFVIDALKRGVSRQLAHDTSLSERSNTDTTILMVEDAPTDETPNGARAVAEFAGRVWFSGFDGEVIDGDARSPRMSSYVMFSQLVKESSNINKCYQQNDPTYEEESDLLATDGGVIRLDEAYGIKRLVPLGDALVVVASNGVWSIRGGDNTGFAADSFIVDKITEQGSVSPTSVIVNGNTLFFWSSNGIHAITPNDIGSLTEENLTKGSIQKLYNKIPSGDKALSSGVFDRYENKVRWTYGDATVSGNSRELVMDLDLQAFYLNEMASLTGESPTLLSPLTVLPYKERDEGKELETAYIALWSSSPLELAFCKYSDLTFVDWKSKDGEGADAAAYFITGYGPQGDFQRRKQVPFITTYMRKTEDGFADVGGDLVPTTPSSCIMQARWDWNDSPVGSKWGRESQVYKNKRVFMPEDASSDFDTGESVIRSKVKVRGHGKTISLLYKTEPLKECNFLGWSTVVDVSTDV